MPHAPSVGLVDQAVRLFWPFDSPYLERGVGSNDLGAKSKHAQIQRINQRGAVDPGSGSSNGDCPARKLSNLFLFG